MQKQELIAKLQQWASEFGDIAGENVAVPPGLWQFLAARIIEAGIPGVDDADVVRAMIGGRLRSVKVLGRNNGRINYEQVDGVGFGCLPVYDFLSDDKEKLANILDRIEGTVP